MRIQSYMRALPIVATAVTLAAASTLAMQTPGLGETSKVQANSTSCRDFVQRFYNWYLTGPKPKGNISKYDYTLKYKTSMFSPTLMQMLHADEKAAAKSPGEVVGLDFDPFINAQDDPGRMVVRKATMKGATCFVDVYRTAADPKESNKPDVTPELTQQNGHWIFVNFHYPASDTPSSDLLSILKGLAADRKKYK